MQFGNRKSLVCAIVLVATCIAPLMTASAKRKPKPARPAAAVVSHIQLDGSRVTRAFTQEQSGK